MSIGYACLTIGVPETDLRSCIKKNASKEKLTEVIQHNLHSLENMIDYNYKNGIKLFRISSDLIPFGSSPVNTLPWWELFALDLNRIGEKIKKYGIRVSMHPGQYTVLNSPREEVVYRAVLDLEYHAKVLDSLTDSSNHKIILHVGGIYNDKKQAMQQFIRNYERLSDSVKRRLVIENDDKSYHIGDVLELAKSLTIPVIFDNLHNLIHPYDTATSDATWIQQCKSTWNSTDGVQKIHYSQQDPLKQPGSHSGTIRINQFMEFYNCLIDKHTDIMLEVKDKNLSALKCIHCTNEKPMIKDLEVEWSRYKYSVLEHSHTEYLSIRQLFRTEYWDKQDLASIHSTEKLQRLNLEFYQKIEHALNQSVTTGSGVNAASHVWGYFKTIATEKEKTKFMNKLNQFEQGEVKLTSVKTFLHKMAEEYHQEYLVNSYYFDI